MEMFTVAPTERCATAALLARLLGCILSRIRSSTGYSFEMYCSMPCWQASSHHTSASGPGGNVKQHRSSKESKTDASSSYLPDAGDRGVSETLTGGQALTSHGTDGEGSPEGGTFAILYTASLSYQERRFWSP